MTLSHFPRWVDRFRPLVGLVLGASPIYALALLYVAGDPRTTDVGYMPEQPVPFSHALHSGQLGLDCRYCHVAVDRAARASIPTTETCMNCHRTIWTQSEKLITVRESLTQGTPIRWVRVHDLPDYSFFDHSAHVSRGVGCRSCHGPVDGMEEVWQDQTLSMGWCLDCHRAPELHLRPPESVTDMAWAPPAATEPLAYGRSLRDRNGIAPPTDCSTCHR